MVKKMVCGETVSGNFVFVLNFLCPCVLKVLGKRVDGLAVLVGGGEVNQTFLIDVYSLGLCFCCCCCHVVVVGVARSTANTLVNNY